MSTDTHTISVFVEEDSATVTQSARNTGTKPESSSPNLTETYEPNFRNTKGCLFHITGISTETRGNIEQIASSVIATTYTAKCDELRNRISSVVNTYGQGM